MDKIGETLNRWIEQPARQAVPPPLAARSATVDDADCLTAAQRRTFATALTAWLAGVQSASAAVEIAARSNATPATLRRLNREVCRTLDAIKPLEPAVAAFVKYAAHVRRYELAETRLVDALNDQLFDAEVKLAAMGW